MRRLFAGTAKLGSRSAYARAFWWMFPNSIPVSRLFGKQLPFPILLAPTGAQALIHPKGDLETAIGAAAANATLVISSSASLRIRTDRSPHNGICLVPTLRTARPCLH